MTSPDELEFRGRERRGNAGAIAAQNRDDPVRASKNRSRMNQSLKKSKDGRIAPHPNRNREQQNESQSRRPRKRSR